jgi:hypothetical protein
LLDETLPEPTSIRADPASVSFQILQKEVVVNGLSTSQPQREIR